MYTIIGTYRGFTGLVQTDLTPQLVIGKNCQCPSLDWNVELKAHVLGGNGNAFRTDHLDEAEAHAEAARSLGIETVVIEEDGVAKSQAS